MAVAEIASSVQHHGRTSAPGVGPADWLPSVLRFSRLAVTLALALNTVAHAQILGDRNAPRNQQPTVLVTPNGVPVVNIQTPSSAGVSMNQYRQFDVGANGVILNNARVTTATQLGGQVTGNPWLATGAARVIVNQVNSTNPSYLRGYLEVAGARAQVVVANPAGISCAGCGFINASRATLTTGLPQVSNGSLESYRVAGGTVSIDGNGMDASRTDYAEIIARAVQVNAGMWAPELKVSAGLNTVSADHASVVPGVAPADGQPAIAIDVAQLGGMYAGHIYLTSTEHGVGVRNAGTIGASVGQAVVTADGRLENSGAISATGPLALQASGGVRNSGELGSQGAVTVTTSTLDNAGSITSTGTLAVQASDVILNTGSVGGEGGVQMTAASIDNRNSIGSSAGLALQASGNTGHIGNSGTLQATRDVTINAATVDNSGTVRASQGALQVTSSAGSTNSGRIEAGQSIAVNAAGSRGNSDGKDVSNVLTHVKAGGQVNIDSGRDTNLIGATVAGEQVVANVGRDLNIASVQDTSTFKSRDQSVGGSATIGASPGGSISASRSRVDADYASVGQQSGIEAGNGGFQINVKGNTDLKGAQIASTDQAVEQGKNSLTTGALTTSDLQNRSQYSADSISVSRGQAEGKPTGGIGGGMASGSESSVTRSGISGGAVTITDAQAQQDRTGQSADQAVASLDTSVRTGKDSSNSLTKNWNGDQLREEVEAQTKITQAFGQQASKLIGDHAEQELDKAKALRKQADDTSDPTLAQELRNQAATLESNWGPEGTMRVLAHTIVGGLTGGLAGAAGAAMGTLTAPNVAAALNKAGVDPDLARELTGLSSTLAGAAVGGVAGGSAAYNEVINNYLKHEEAARLSLLRDKQLVGQCNKDCESEITSLEQLDKKRDIEFQA
ncbi:filamentous hemagglutinin family protein [Herbaspirillum frisingense]|uniref:Filamentous hemagglutinin family protein n=2 Tax=Herbaspirillum frisingense TaxID=92645 RepID=A0ABU1PKM9_9BURK|nr:filamentous hemagglutinin family protein [Herbaspirillum frisingense]